MVYDLLIIGAGAAGLTAAVASARRGISVLIAERNAEAGRKILLAGGGRCNLTNAALDLPAGDFSRLYPNAGKFVRPALRAFPGAALRDFFAELGVPLICPDSVHYYPQTEKGRTVRDALLNAARSAGAVLAADAEITAMTCHASGWTASTAAGKEFTGKICLLAAGGIAPLALCSRSPWTLAAAAGHPPTAPRPALAPLYAAEFNTDNGWRELAGVSIGDAALSLAAAPKKIYRGSLLFTHHGLSGPAALDISGDVADALAAEQERPVNLRVNFLPEIKDWKGLFTLWRQESGKKTMRNQFRGMLPEALLSRLFAAINLPPERLTAELTARESTALAAAGGAYPFTICRRDDFSKAMVTRGGVPLGDVEAKTLKSRRMPALYFAGEILDVDGLCGGFNLHWAFASGKLAAESAAASLQNDK